MLEVTLAPPIFPASKHVGTTSEVEARLKDWFGRPVILTSSGRSALLLCLRELGLQRYKSRVAMSPRTAQCVFDAVTRAAFPVDPASDLQPVDASLIIHQYGYRLTDRPVGPVIEDICHAFFASECTGAREWLGDMAVFSLPKFFGVAGMAGGIVAANDGLAEALRQRRDSAPRLSKMQFAADRADWRSGDPLVLDEIYLRALLHPSVDRYALAGLPFDFAYVGALRAASTNAILASIPAEFLDDSWRRMCSEKLPYAVPVFAGQGQSACLAEALRFKGIEAGVYQIDFARKMTSPDLRAAVLLPCHHGLDGIALQTITETLKLWSQQVAREAVRPKGDDQ